MAECSRLESDQRATSRGFKSHTHRSVVVSTTWRGVAVQPDSLRPGRSLLRDDRTHGDRAVLRAARRAHPSGAAGTRSRPGDPAASSGLERTQITKVESGSLGVSALELGRIAGALRLSILDLAGSLPSLWWSIGVRSTSQRRFWRVRSWTPRRPWTECGLMPTSCVNAACYVPSLSPCWSN